MSADPYSDYRAEPAVNWSALRYMAISPVEYRYRLAHQKEPTQAMRDGLAAHCATLEPDEFPRRYVLWDGGIRRGRTWDEFAAVNDGKDILTAAEYDRALAIRDAVRANPDAAAILGACAAERVLRWTDDETGMPCKGRPDLLGGGILADLKTTRTIDKRLFAKSAADLDYFGQLAFYAMGAEAIGIAIERVCIIAVEAAEDSPHDNVVFDVSGEALYAGRERARELLDRLAQCTATDRWPGRYEGTQPLDAPGWYGSTEDIGDELVFLGLAPEKGTAP
jgi:hypothetical protein